MNGVANDFPSSAYMSVMLGTNRVGGMADNEEMDHRSFHYTTFSVVVE